MRLIETLQRVGLLKQLSPLIVAAIGGDIGAQNFGLLYTCRFAQRHCGNSHAPGGAIDRVMMTMMTDLSGLLLKCFVCRQVAQH